MPHGQVAEGAMSSLRKLAQAAPKLSRSLKTSSQKCSGGPTPPASHGHHDVSLVPAGAPQAVQFAGV